LAGFDAAALKLGGYDYFALKEAGFSREELNDAGFVPEAEVCDAFQRAVQFVADYCLLTFSVVASCRISASRGRIPPRNCIVYFVKTTFVITHMFRVLNRSYVFFLAAAEHMQGSHPTINASSCTRAEEALVAYLRVFWQK
jgi:hypothetical protein